MRGVNARLTFDTVMSRNCIVSESVLCSHIILLVDVCVWFRLAGWVTFFNEMSELPFSFYNKFYISWMS